MYNKEVQTMVTEEDTPLSPQATHSDRVTREREETEEDHEAEDRKLEQENAQLEKEIEQEIRGNVFYNPLTVLSKYTMYKKLRRKSEPVCLVRLSFWIFSSNQRRSSNAR